MTEKHSRQYGLWDSPITPRSLAASLRLEAARWSGDGKTLVWLEGRSGKGILVAQAADGNAPRNLTSDLSVRAEVGYGGGFRVWGEDGLITTFVLGKSGDGFRFYFGLN